MREDPARDAGVRERVGTSLRRAAGWLVAQLVIVFLGAYAASLAADRQDAAARGRRRARLLRAQLLRALAPSCTT